MKTQTNIYDVDGELIRSYGDNHEFTIDEARERVNLYTNKLKDLPEDDPKRTVYRTYITNLTNYIFKQYSKLTPEQLNKMFAQPSKEEQMEKAINELKKELDDTEIGENTEEEIPRSASADNPGDTNAESGDVKTINRELSGIHEEESRSQRDFLVERDGINNTVMDEYVDFTEI